MAGTSAGSTEPSPFELKDQQLERRLLSIVPPAVLLFAFALINLDTWRMLARTFMTMWVHEIGHTLAAWFSGRFALPGPWVTRLGEGRSAIVIVLLAASIAWLGYRGWCAGRRWQLAIAAVLFAVQLTCTFFRASGQKDALIAFSGDGGMLVLGAALMLTFWAPPKSYVHRQWLRWGFVVIGAFAFADATMSWLQARGDPSTIPYGEIEGVGHSDPTKLVFDYGWSQASMIRAYLAVAALSLMAVTARYAAQIWQWRKSDNERRDTY